MLIPNNVRNSRLVTAVERIVRDAGAMRAKWFGTAAITLVMVGITGCTTAPVPVPDDAWLVSPISYDNAMDGEPANRIDVTYSMQKMTGDTAGGFWTESAGCWLHIDRYGEAASRFNDDSSIRVHGISAISPTVLAVSREDGGRPAGLYLLGPCGPGQSFEVRMVEHRDRLRTQIEG